MQLVAMADIRAAYGTRDDRWFDRPVMSLADRRLSHGGIREGATYYFYGSERAERPGRPRLHWAYIMDQGMEVVAIGQPFLSETGANLMRDKAYACAWTGRLVSCIVPLARAAKIHALSDHSQEARRIVEGWATEVGGTIEWTGREAYLHWPDAAGVLQVDRPEELLETMTFRIP